MSIADDILPLTEMLVPPTQAELAAIVAQAAEKRTPIYPVGGGTSLHLGATPREPGLGLSLAGLNRVIDYPARDMTITAEAGVTLDQLAKTLATERQWLPVDVPFPEKATLGGAIATAAAGARRYGYGTLRDYVIGISAVDGAGMPFQAGGRVVKNVAGYDFCKLLTGSLGTLGVITQVTLKIRPLPERTAFVVCAPPSVVVAEQCLAALVTSQTTPIAIEWLVGPHWRDAEAPDATGGAPGKLAVVLEGSAAEVAWMISTLQAEWQAQGVSAANVIEGEQAAGLWQRLRDFPAQPQAPLLLKASVPASHTLGLVQQILTHDRGASIQAHAGSGVVLAAFSAFSGADVSKVLIGDLHPWVRQVGGSLVVLASAGAPDLTRQARWGNVTESSGWMLKVKQQFDPHGILNPGRFVYES